MENYFTDFRHIFTVLTFTIIIVVDGQQSSGTSVCTGPMLRSFSSCIGYLTGTSNSSSPTSACCGSLRDLMSNGEDCLCLIVTGGVPFQVPINRNLAMSLPRACKMSGVPIECKATSSPIPAPEPRTPSQNGPNISPRSSPPSPRLSPPSPRAPFIPQPLTPPSPPTTGGGMTPFIPPPSDSIPIMTPPGMRPTLTPSAAQPPSYSALPISLLVSVLGFFLLKC